MENAKQKVGEFLRAIVPDSANGIIYGTAIGSLFLALSGNDPNVVFAGNPLAIALYTSIGSNAIVALLDRFSSTQPPTIEQIREAFSAAIEDAQLQYILENPDFISSTFSAAGEQIVEQVHELIKEANEELALQITTAMVSLINDSQKKYDEQFEDIVNSIKNLHAFLSHHGVFSLYPKTRRPLLEIPLIGREDELASLETNISNRQDTLVVGQPGSGKTFLFHQILSKDHAFYVVGEDRVQLERAIRALQPKVLLIDDVHNYLELLKNLRQLRRETGIPFVICANCWLSKRKVVETEMGLIRKDVLILEKLSRGKIAQIIRSIDLEIPEQVILEIVNQADGRPGLAITLAEAYQHEGILDILEGEIVSNHLYRIYILNEYSRPRLGQILAALSIGGDQGFSPELVANALRIPVHESHEILEALSELAAGGIIVEDENTSFLTVHPPVLRDVLIKENFFSRGFYPLTKPIVDYLVSAATDLAQLALTLLSAKRRGADIPDELIRQVIIQMDEHTIFLTQDQIEVWCYYALSGHDQASWVLAYNSKHLKIEHVAPYTLNLIPEITIPLLLNRAIGDNRSLNGHPEHPLRILTEWATDPRGDRILHKREQLLEYTKEWFAEIEELDIFLKAILLVVEAELEFTYGDPIEGKKLTIQNGHFTTFGIEGISKLWTQVREVIARLTILDWKQILHIVHSWIFYENSNFTGKLPEEVALAAKNFALILCQDVAKLAKNHNGVLQALNKYSEWTSLYFTENVNAEFAVLYPIEDLDNYDETEQSQIKAAQALVENWISSDYQEIVSRIARFESEAKEAGTTYPRYTAYVARSISQACKNPTEWLGALLSTNVQSDIVEPFMERVSLGDRDVWVEMLRKAISLNTDVSNYVAASSVLRQTNFDEEIFEIIAPILGGMDRLVEWVASGDAIPQATVDKLLQSDNRVVAKAAARGLWDAKQEEIHKNPLAFGLWLPIAMSELESDEVLAGLFERHSELALQWIRSLVSQKYMDYFKYRTTLHRVTNSLSISEKREVLSWIDDPSRHYPLIEQLVGTEFELFQFLVQQTTHQRVWAELLPPANDPNWSEWVILLLDTNDEDKRKEILYWSTRVRSKMALTQAERIQSLQALLQAYEQLVNHKDNRIVLLARDAQSIIREQIENIRRQERDRST